MLGFNTCNYINIHRTKLARPNIKFHDLYHKTLIAWEKLLVYSTRE